MEAIFGKRAKRGSNQKKLFYHVRAGRLPWRILIKLAALCRCSMAKLTGTFYRSGAKLTRQVSKIHHRSCMIWIVDFPIAFARGGARRGGITPAFPLEYAHVGALWAMRSSKTGCAAPETLTQFAQPGHSDTGYALALPDAIKRTSLFRFQHHGYFFLHCPIGPFFCSSFFFGRASWRLAQMSVKR